MKKTVLLLFIFTSFIFSSCSSLQSVYIPDGYTENRDAMIKKVQIIVKTSKEFPELAPLVANIAADIIKLKTNYLVYDYKTIPNESQTPECNNKTQGIFIFSIQHAIIKKNKIHLDLMSELFDCKSKEILWHAHAFKTTESDNADLKELTIEYEEKYKNSATIFAAPAFIIIQDIVDSVPNPDLTDDEVNFKIKLDAKK